MPPYEIPDKIDDAFVQGLVDRKQSESKHFEFKRKLGDIQAERTKRKLVERASAFANEEGGFLIYGVREGENEDKGKAVEITGINCLENDDVLQNAIENIIRSWVNPALVGVDVIVISMNTGERVLVLHVPKRRSLPHQVIKGGSNKFYRRHSSGIYEPDVEELSQMFGSTTSSEDAQALAKGLRDEHIQAILNGQLLAKLLPGPRIVVQVIPSRALATSRPLDLSPLPNPIENSLSHNSEGLIEANNKDYYYQLFRNGSIECVQSYFPKVEENKIPINELELEARHYFLPIAFRWLKRLSVSPPCYVWLSLLNVRGFTLDLSQDLQRYARYETFHVPHAERNRPFHKDHLHVGVAIAETLEPDIDALIRPALDEIWQAFQYPRSLNFTVDGKWRGPTQ
ncbi:MAG: ATP-binding protein [Anaerolineaceae bacterium]|nr:ATP-binding protein [Anaerolineaceae bacterium]